MLEFNYRSDPRSLYIHWPFCPYKCHFCDFVAIASHDEYMEQYHQALLLEINSFIKECGSKKLEVETLYIGGGTPSTYPTHLLADTFDLLKNNMALSPTIEISIEMNPGTITPEKLDVWKEIGINRISMGVQSLNDTVLKKLNRHQSVEDVVNAITIASQRFTAVSIDLILGLPGISVEEWKSMMARVVQWPIVHISVYFLMVHENTPLYFGVKSNKITLPCDDEVVDLYFWTIDFLALHGFEQYEISNFARGDNKSRHNSAYWERKPFKGFGLGACSFDGRTRLQNQKKLMVYMEGVQKGQTITIFSEELSREQLWLETIMLGLRQTRGIVIDRFSDYLTQEEKEKILTKIVLLEQQGLIKQDQGTVRLTPKALAVENEVIVQLTL